MNGLRHVRIIQLFAAIVVVATTFFTSIDAGATERSLALAGLKVTEWSPDNAPRGRLPIVILSHGFHGCATQSRFLVEALASAGYLVFAPNHRDAACDGGESSWHERSEVPFVKPATWTDDSYRDRANDIRRLIEALRSDPEFKQQIDWSRLGLMGHSLGGYTVLGLDGAWPSWKLGGVRAVLALSPCSQPFVVHGTLHGLTSPVMYQSGTRDFGITPSIEKNAGAYDQSPPPKYYVEFDRATHFAWNSLGRVARDQITAYSVAFMNFYLKGAPPDPILMHAMQAVAVLRSDLK